MIRKFLITFLFVLMIFSSISCFADNDIRLKINDKEIKMDVPPVIVNDRTLIPVRVLFENVGGEVEWFPETQRVVINYNDIKIILAIGRDTAFVSGKELKLDSPAQIINDRTLIPVRFVSENLGFNVEWDEKSHTVSVNTKRVNKYKLSNVNVTYDSTYIIITVKGVGKIKADYKYLENPDRMIFDFKDCTMSATDKEIAVTDGVVKKVRLGQYVDDTARVVIDTDKIMTYKIQYTVNDCIIKIKKNQKTEINSSFKSSYKLSDPELKEALVIIDPGHGGSDVGAIGVYNGEDIYEKTLDIKISTYLNTYLKNSGVSTYMIRDGDQTVDIYDRPEIANEKDGYLYLSIHNNAAANTEAKGVQVFYSDSTPSFENIKNKKWAQVFYDEIASLGLNKAGLKDNNKYIVINKTKMPAAILECAFMTNKDDLEKLLDDEFLKQIAMKIGDATIKVLNMSVE